HLPHLPVTAGTRQVPASTPLSPFMEKEAGGMRSEHHPPRNTTVPYSPKKRPPAGGRWFVRALVVAAPGRLGGRGRPGTGHGGFGGLGRSSRFGRSRRLSRPGGFGFCRRTGAVSSGGRRGFRRFLIRPGVDQVI